MACLLVVGFIANALIRPVAERHDIGATGPQGVGRARAPADVAGSPS